MGLGEGASKDVVSGRAWPLGTAQVQQPPQSCPLLKARSQPWCICSQSCMRAARRLCQREAGSHGQPASGQWGWQPGCAREPGQDAEAFAQKVGSHAENHLLWTIYSACGCSDNSCCQRHRGPHQPSCDSYHRPGPCCALKAAECWRQWGCLPSQGAQPLCGACLQDFTSAAFSAGTLFGGESWLNWWSEIKINPFR